MVPPSAGRLWRAARIALTMGLWLAPAALSAQSLNTTTLSFGNQAVNTTTTRQIAFKNTLLAPVTLTSVSVSGGDAGDFVATPVCVLPAIIQPGTYCVVNVRFTPPVMLARSSTLFFSHSGPAGPLSAVLMGMGVSPVSLAPAPVLSFGNVLLGTTSATRTAVLTNALSVPLPIISISLFPASYVRTGGTCPTGAGTLAAKAQCTILVAFAPTVAGAVPGTLHVSHSANANPPSLSLSGTGMPALATSTSSLTFPTRTVGTAPSPAKGLTVANRTPAPIAFGSITASGDFAVSGGTCGASLAAGAQCVIGVTFAPTAVGARAGTLSIGHSALGSPVQVMLSGIGNATGLVSLAVTPVNPSIPAGGSVAFAAAGTFMDGHSASLTTSVVWSLIGTPGVAAISNTAGTQGVAQGLNGGTATVRATLGAIAGSTLLTVTSAAPSSIVVTPAQSSIGLGMSQQFTATATFSGGGTSNVTATAAWDQEFQTRGRLTNGLYTAIASGSNTVSAAVGSTVGHAGVTSPGPIYPHREQITTTRLLDGRVLIAGGLDPSLITRSEAEIFNPATGTFTSVPSMSTPRRWHTATLLPDGRVLVAGGVPTSSNSIPTATAEIFDPASGTWSPTGSMTTNRGYHTATLVGTKVLLAAGYNGSATLNSAELYDPSTGTFTSTGSLANSRRFYAAARLADGRVLAVGGSQTPVGGPQTRLASAEIYDPASGTWSTTGAMATTRTGHTATLLLSNRVLVVGGFDGVNNSSSAEVFNPTLGTWSGTGAVHTTVSFHTASLLPTGQVLVAGGGGTDLRATAVYDPASGVFLPGPPLAFKRSIPSAAVLNNGAVLVVGGNGLQFDPPEGALSAEIRLDGAVMTGLTVEPGTNSVTHPSTIPYHAIATFSDGSRGDVSAQVTWTVTPASVAMWWGLNGTGMDIATVGPGVAIIRATLGTFSFEATLVVN